MKEIYRVLSKRQGVYPMDYDIEDIDGEVWRDVTGYDGIYSVSNLARIKSERRQRIMKQQASPSNPHNLRFKSFCLAVSFSVDKEKRTFKVGQLVGDAFLGEKKEDEVYSKKNKLWYDCRADNLEIKTVSKSMVDSYSLGFCDRNKKTLTHNHEPVWIYKRLVDGVEFIGGKGLTEGYGCDMSSNIKRAIKKDTMIKGSKWEMVKIKKQKL